MMRNSIATYKESLSRITSDVQSADNALENATARGGEDAWIADRRVSHRFAQSTSPRRFPFVDNGVGSASAAEIELHKAEIQRLKTSEAEIKALAVNYAAILKEKEEELSRIHEENNKLKKIVDPKAAFTQVSKAENFEVYAEQSPRRQYSHASQRTPRSTLNNEQRALPKQQLSMNGSIQAGQFEGVNQKMFTNLQGSEKEPEYPINGNGRTMSQKQMKHASEVRELRVQLGVERENLASVTRNFQEQHKKNESLQKVLHDLEMEKNRMSLRIKEMQNDTEVKVSEIKQLQLELDRKNLDEESNGSLAMFQDAVLALQNENAILKMEKVELESKLKYKMEHEHEKFEARNSELANKYSSLNEQGSNIHLV